MAGSVVGESPRSDQIFENDTFNKKKMDKMSSQDSSKVIPKKNNHQLPMNP